LFLYSPPHLLTRLSMSFVVLYTTQLPSSLNGIIGVLYPKPPHQSQWDYWGAVPQTSSLVYQWDYWGAVPQTSSLVYQWDYWGAAPQTSSPVSMGLLGCCTPNLLTSLNGIIGVLHPNPPHQSQWDYWGAVPQTSSLVYQ